ncbi:hypothetical protein ADU59_05785 [Pararhizobium polonicum]|uniref:Uncharacterized protein n=1 Tax=Pararhizobium polonicum TaxID=1612624 RepID=A0A1C7P5A2_9HYPH|nr:hypothetical protein [Pararhizobium polonicum]OBZ96428.1 hypothetical protein ADU59_05785 [Pararhizobium polonicum]
MKKIDDLIASATSIHDRYKAGRMERETVREWVLGLGGYPAPYAEPLSEAAAWFRPLRDLEPDALKVVDLEKLKAVADAGAVDQRIDLSLGRSR